MGCIVSEYSRYKMLINRPNLLRNLTLLRDQQPLNETIGQATTMGTKIMSQNIRASKTDEDTDSIKNALVDFFANNYAQSSMDEASMNMENGQFTGFSNVMGQTNRTAEQTATNITTLPTTTIEKIPLKERSLQYICNTEVSFEWLFDRLIEKFKCPDEPEPQWIVEKMNIIGGKDLDKTTVLKVTFGWDNSKLPKSVVLKICQKNEEESPEEDKLAFKLFRRECHAYEWLSKHRKMSVPKVFVIKKLPSETCNALIVMEDLSERSQIGELSDGICLEGVRDLLRILAQIHALSMQNQSWILLLGEHTQFYYNQTAKFIEDVAKCWPIFENPKFQLKECISSVYLSKISKNACSYLKCQQCIVHGNPITRNIFLSSNQRKATAIIDWTQSHPGCYGEDLAKAICWNLTPKERQTHLTKLLQFYHYNLLKLGNLVT